MSIENIMLVKENGQDPLYIQLYNEINKLIKNRTLKDNEKLPTIREFSEKLNVNSVTIVNAYKLLEKNGFIEKKVGSGSFVKYYSVEYETTALDLTGSDSNIDCFPFTEITDSFKYVLNNHGIQIFKHEDSTGFMGLKETLVNYFSYYNIETKKESIQIVSGGQQALDIISKALLDFGESVFSETPTYIGAINSFKSREARILYINIETDGLNIEELQSKLEIRRPSFIYLMTFFQKPTGVTYSLEKKLKILELAQKYNFYIIEDDLGSEICSSQDRTLKSLDKFDKVIYIKSFSPLYMPGLRLGCIITPEDLDKKFTNIKQTTDISTPALIQRGFSHYLNKNNWKDHYKIVEENLLNKITLTNSILTQDFLELISFNINYSPVYWLKLKKGNGLELKNICTINGIKIIPGEEMGADYSNYFSINLKSIPISNIKKALEILKLSLEQLYLNN